MPKEVEYIGDNAFSLNQIGEINIPDTVEFIGVSAFYKNNLTEVKLPEKAEDLKNFNKKLLLFLATVFLSTRT